MGEAPKIEAYIYATPDICIGMCIFCLNEKLGCTCKVDFFCLDGLLDEKFVSVWDRDIPEEG